MKLSKFILEIIEKIDQPTLAPHYFPDSSTWHQPPYRDYSSTCSACLAGLYAGAEGWMHPTATLDPYATEEDQVLSLKQRRTMAALDHIRTGNWYHAQENLDIPEDKRIAWDTPGRPSPPKYHCFYGWTDFNFHLESLRQKGLQLQQLGF